MNILEVFDPPMCCSSGVCGPEVEPKLAQFSGDLDWLKSQGVEVRRFNLAQEPQRFVERAGVKALLDHSGSDELPQRVQDELGEPRAVDHVGLRRHPRERRVVEAERAVRQHLAGVGHVPEEIAILQRLGETQPDHDHEDEHREPDTPGARQDERTAVASGSRHVSDRGAGRGDHQ